MHDPTAGILNADPFEMATGLPLVGESSFDPENIGRGLLAAAELGTPEYLKEGYKGPEAGSYAGNLAAGLGQLFQGGSGAEGVLGGGGAIISQALGGLPAANEALGISGGLGARHAPLKSLPEYTTRTAEMRRMSPEAQLSFADELFKETGWDRPYKDLNYRFEIPDKNAEINPDVLELLGNENEVTTALDKVLMHEELYRNYPDLANLPVTLKSLPKSPLPGVSGSMFHNSGKEKIELYVPENAEPFSILSALLHETQHGVQNKEELIQWSNWDQPTNIISPPHLTTQLNTKLGNFDIARALARKVYLNSALEAEARNTQGRLMAQRGEKDPIGAYAHTPPWGKKLNEVSLSSSSPVPFEDQILQIIYKDPLKFIPPSWIEDVKLKQKIIDIASRQPPLNPPRK